MLGLTRGQVGLEVGPQRPERQVGRAGGVAPDHPEVAVLLQLQRGRVVVLDPPPDGVQRPHPRVAHPGEDQLGRDPGPDHLVVDDVGGEPAQGQVAPPLADHLVAGRERDQVGEALDGQGVAVAHQLGDGVAHGRDLVLSHRPPRRPGRPGRARGRETATSSTASVNSRRAVRHWSAVTTRGGDSRTVLSPPPGPAGRGGSRPAGPPRPASAGGELDAEHQADPADVGDQPGEAAPQLAPAPPGAARRRAVALSSSSSSRIDLERGQAGRAGHRAAAVGGAVGALAPQRSISSSLGQERAQGQARGDALGRDQDVGLDVGVLDRPHPAGAAHAGLDLVGDQQDAVALAQRA